MPDGPPVRRREAAYLAVHAAPDNFTLLTGDFNSASPHDPEPEGFDALPAQYRARYLAEDLQTADRSVLAHLEAAGGVDIGHALWAARTLQQFLRRTLPAPSLPPCAAITFWHQKYWRLMQSLMRLSVLR